jgi:hypothetical protein
MFDDAPLETYKYLLGEIEKRNLLFVEISREDPQKQVKGDLLKELRPFY